MPAKAYRFLFNGRVNCSPAGADKKLVPPAKKTEPAERPAYLLKSKRLTGKCVWAFGERKDIDTSTANIIRIRLDYV